MNQNDLKDALLTANNIAIAGMESGRAIGARVAAAKAKPLLDALEESTELLLHTSDENDEGAIAEQIKINRAAIEAYRKERAS